MCAFLLKDVLLRIYKQTILPIIDYCSIVWHDCGTTLTKRVEKKNSKSSYEDYIARRKKKMYSSNTE